MERQARFSRARRPHGRQQAHIGTREEITDDADLSFTSDEGGGGSWRSGEEWLAAHRRERRKVRRQTLPNQLEEPGHAGNVFEAACPQLPHAHSCRQSTGQQVVSCPREEDLTSVADAHQAGGQVDVEAHVAIFGGLGIAGMNAHTHAHSNLIRPVGGAQSALGGHGGRYRINSPLKDDEEGVTLRINLVAVALLKRGTTQTSTQFEYSDVEGAA